MLSQREKEIYRLMVEGKGVKEIAQILIVEPTTVKTHFQRIYKKKNVHSQKEILVNRIKELETWIKRRIQLMNR